MPGERKINLPTATLKALESLPKVDIGRISVFSDEMDQEILYARGRYQWNAFADYFKEKYGFGTAQTLLKRYRILAGDIK